MAWTRWWRRISLREPLVDNCLLTNKRCSSEMHFQKLKICNYPKQRIIPIPVLNFPPVSTKTCRRLCSRISLGQRNLYTSSRYENGVRPRMIYAQNPFVWLSNRWEFFVLRKQWDPNFKLDEFLMGCKQALCTITEYLSEEDYDALRGLISAKTLEKLKEEILKGWNEDQRKAVKLLPEQVHVVLPHKVYLRQYKGKKTCDVDMILIAFKPTSSGQANSVGLLIEVAARFHRNYSEGMLPDWTVTHLHLTSRDVQIKQKNS